MANSGEQRPIGSRSHDLEGFTGLPPRHDGPRRSGGVLRRLLNIVLLLAALVLIGGMAWLVLSWSGGSKHTAATGTRVRVVVPKNASADQIADVLTSAGVVRHKTVFRAKLKLNGDGANFHAGTYQMKTGASYDSIVRALNRAPVAAPTYKLTIPEGLRLEETAARIDRMRRESQAAGGAPQPGFTGAEYLAAVNSLKVPPAYGAPAGTTSMEGLLFPATYELRMKATAADFVVKQQEAFAQNIARIDMSRAKQANLSIYDVVTIASLAEREGRTAHDRSLVSAVIWNRLKLGMTLGIDASTQYSSYEPGSDEFWVSELKQSQLDKPSPYNLRKNTGLPPTPIAEPGLESLAAAANPAKVKYLYYVNSKKNDGSLFFSESYDAFLAEQR